jgi:uncharacterized coiled-coil DUF342 family protein
MSSAALAKKRRANLSAVQEVPSSPAATPAAAPQSRAGGMSLPQILNVIEKRILSLEKAVEDNRDASSSKDVSEPIDIDAQLRPIIDEYDARFEMLATQINEMKDALMKLQSFTMDVNKTLFEERNSRATVSENTQTEEAIVPITETPTEEQVLESIPEVATEPPTFSTPEE